MPRVHLRPVAGADISVALLLVQAMLQYAQLPYLIHPCKYEYDLQGSTLLSAPEYMHEVEHHLAAVDNTDACMSSLSEITQ